MNKWRDKCMMNGGSMEDGGMMDKCMNECLTGWMDG